MNNFKDCELDDKYLVEYLLMDDFGFVPKHFHFLIPVVGYFITNLVFLSKSSNLFLKVLAIFSKKNVFILLFRGALTKHSLVGVIPTVYPGKRNQEIVPDI